MKRHFLFLTALGAAFAVLGCSLDGTWRTVRTDPEEAMEHDPFQVVTFSDGTYSSTGTMGGQERTSTGTYTWSGMKLTITPEGEGAETREYAGSRNIFSGQLKLTHEHDGQKTAAYLEKDQEN